MDTVKVDLQKLQLLNDRIAQTIDALNQVRLSTHGLQHSLASQLLAQGMQAQVPFGAQPQFGQVPFNVQPQFGQVPYGAQAQIGQLPIGQLPITQGISHTVAPMFQQQDPYWQYRMAQSFPYAPYQSTPIAW